MGDFRFNHHRVRKAGLPSTAHAKALKALWKQPRHQKEMRRTFGPQIVSYLEQNGCIELVGEEYRLTEHGMETLHGAGYQGDGLHG